MLILSAGELQIRPNARTVVGGQLAISEMNFTLTRRMFSSE